jgi:two-component system response regulator CpxR
MVQNREEGTTRILIVDDDLELCELVGRYLAARGFQVDVEGDGAAGLRRAQEDGYALLVLDVMLPSLDGFEVLRRLRSGPRSTLPVVMLTAHGDEVDRIVGLELGADDYLPKPFNPRELLARIRAILRRSASDSSGAADSTIDVNDSKASLSHVAATPAAQPDSPNQSPANSPLPAITLERLVEGDMVLDTAARMAWRNNEEIDLTATEFDLLHAMMRAAGRVVRRDELARDVLERRLLPFDRSLDLHMSKLRRKIGPTPEGQERIRTVRGVGYLFVRH